MHWRLETYGVFYPEGKSNGQALRKLLRQTPSYYRWLGEMDELKKNRLGGGQKMPIYD